VTAAVAVTVAVTVAVAVAATAAVAVAVTGTVAVGYCAEFGRPPLEVEALRRTPSGSASLPANAGAEPTETAEVDFAFDDVVSAIAEVTPLARELRTRYPADWAG